MILFRLFFSIFGAIFLLFLTAVDSSASPRFGLWVEAEGTNRPFDTKKDFERYLDFTSKGNFSDLYCQVYRQGRSWYPSAVADDGPYRKNLEQGFDVLRDSIDVAHSRGQKVHAWVNALRIKHNPNAPLFKVIGKKAALSDSLGNNLLDYDEEGKGPGKYKGILSLGTPGVWLESSSREVRNYLLETIRDVVVAYPDLDGIHLDMIRMPLVFSKKRGGAFAVKPALGYGRKAIERFHRVTPHRIISHEQKEVNKLVESEDYKNWRRAQVTLFVYQVRQLLNKIAPEMELSVAVLPSARNAYLYANQDWPEWMREGLIDTVVPMAYSKNNSNVSRYSQFAIRLAQRTDSKVLVGLGAWLMTKRVPQLALQSRNSIEQGSDGVVLFSYSNILPKSGYSDLVDAVSQQVF